MDVPSVPTVTTTVSDSRHEYRPQTCGPNHCVVELTGRASKPKKESTPLPTTLILCTGPREVLREPFLSGDGKTSTDTDSHDIVTQRQSSPD